jgi:hypothetical protein
MPDNDSVLKKAAKAVGKAAGTVAGKAGTQSSKPAPEDLYKAEYVGSGTFKIKKPKRNSRKTHQARVKNDRGGRI